MCGFLKPPESDRQWKARLHVAVSIHRDMSWACARMIKAANTKPWLLFDFVGRHDLQPQREKPCQRILLNERSSITAGKAGTSAILFATIRFRRDIATFRARPWVRPTSRVLRASSPSDLTTLNSLVRQTHVSRSFLLLIIHIACMTIPTRRASSKKKKMNSMNDSGEFQDVESKKSGRLSHVFGQLVMLPSSRSFAQPRLKIAVWPMESIWIAGKRFW